MVIDYKHYSKGYKPKAAPRRIGRFIIPFLAIGILYGAAYVWVGRVLSKGRAAVEAGMLDEAQARFQQAKKLRIRGREAEDGLGIVELHRGNMSAAREHLLRGGRSAFVPAKVMGDFTSKGKYTQADLYGDYARGWNTKPETMAELAVALLGKQKRKEAGQILTELAKSKDPRVAARIGAVKKVLDASNKSQAFTPVSDRANMPLASYPFTSGAAPPSDPEIGGGLRLGRALAGDDIYNHTLLNIDRELQEAASASLGYAGGIVVVDPQSGEILAAVSNPLPGSTAQNFALEGAFEPGSIIKLITLSSALRTDFDLTTIFPFKCTGSVDCDGKPFYDWAIHGMVNDIEQATAESCNVAFAKIGLALGRDALKRELQAYGFGRAPLESPPDMSFGAIAEVGPESLHTAHLSVGLEDLTITPLHAALIAAALARNGNVMMPRLIREKRNILQEPFFKTAPATLFETGLGDDDRQAIVRAMTQVVTSQTGTGRRAAVEGLKFALKTGTSGKRELGLDGVIIGMAPLDSPKIAFCIYAHGSGKAELEGARITHDFLTRIRGRL